MTRPSGGTLLRFLLLFSLAFPLACERRIAALREELGRRPDDPEIRLELAAQLVDAGRIEEALEQYEATVELDGDRVEAFLPMARIYARLGLFDDARICGELMLWKNPDSIEGHRLVARSLLSLDPPRRTDVEEHLASLRRLGHEEALQPFVLGEEESLMGLLRHRAEIGPFVVRAVEEGLAADLRRMLGFALRRLEPLYGAGESGGRRIRVYVFQRREEYLAYAARHRPQWGDYGGFYCPRSGKIVTYATPSEGGRKRWLPRVLLHELSHALMHRALRGRYGAHHPVWFDEGLADVHSTGWPTRSDFAIPGTDEGMVARARWMVARKAWTPLPAFIRLPAIRSNEHYAQAWALVQWMRLHRPAWIEALLVHLRKHEDGRHTFELLAGDLDALDGVLREWLQEL